MTTGISIFQLQFTQLAQELGESCNVEILLRYLQERRVPAGEAVLRFGETDRSLYLIAEGRLVLSISGKNGLPVHLGYYGPGQWVGEAGFIDAQPSVLDVLAKQDSLLLAINHIAFDALVASAPTVAGALLRTLSQSMTEQLRQCIRPACELEPERPVSGMETSASREAGCLAMLRQLHRLEVVEP